MRPLRRPSYAPFLSRLALAVAALVGLADAAQAQGRITAATDVRSAPEGTTVAQLAAGTSWPTGATRGGYVSVTITAWVDASRFAGPRDSFPVTIGGSSNLRIREQPSLQGRILGSFRAGAGMQILERRDGWARVRREVWVPSSAIEVSAPARPAARPPAAQSGGRPSPGTTTPPSPQRPAAAPATTAPSNAGAAAAPATSVPAAGALRAQRQVTLRNAPNGTDVGRLDSGLVVTPQARERGWVKVQVEAWVPESEFVPADTAFGATVSAADLRADPDGYRGRIVRWQVQVVGMQLADPLRRDMAADEPFLLVLGPAGENATIYVTVPQGLITQARAIPPLTSVLLTARIRTGRSNPTGAPILELISIADIR